MSSRQTTNHGKEKRCIKRLTSQKKKKNCVWSEQFDPRRKFVCSSVPSFGDVHPTHPPLYKMPPTNIALILFPGFQLLDATGPLDAFSLLALQHPLQLSILAATLDPVPTQNAAQTAQGSAFSASIVPTHTFADPPQDMEVVLLPGGLGARYVFCYVRRGVWVIGCGIWGLC
jgi:hypothetical protein